MWLVSKPDPLYREEGSGHMLTFEFSPGRNADLTNDCQRWLIVPLKRFISPGFHMFSVTNDYTVKLIGSFNHGVISYPGCRQARETVVVGVLLSYWKLIAQDNCEVSGPDHLTDNHGNHGKLWIQLVGCLMPCWIQP